MRHSTLKTIVRIAHRIARVSGFAGLLSCADASGPAGGELMIEGSTPADGALRVARTAPITVTFSETLDPASISVATFRVLNAATGAEVAGAVTYEPEARRSVFTPASPLATNARYTVSIAASVRSEGGKSLAADRRFSFTTLVQAEGSLRARHNTTCGLSLDGAAYCWGANQYGQAGNGNKISPLLDPVAVTGGLRFSALSLSEVHTCGVALSGSFCWGANSRGELGDGTRSDPRPVPTRIVNSDSFSQIDASGNRNWAELGPVICSDIDCSVLTCALSADRGASCWGYTVTNVTQSPAPERIAGNLRFSEFSTGINTWCGIASDAATYCWENAVVPVSEGRSFETVSTGWRHSCAIERGGAAYCWGFNDFGQLGAETGSACFRPCSRRPVAVRGGHRFTQVSASTALHSCGVTIAHDVYCWGNNRTGQLGNGTFADSGIPMRVLSNQKFASVSAGLLYSCAVTREGVGYCWGDNASGQLGDGSTAGSSIPVRVRMPAGLLFR